MTQITPPEVMLAVNALWDPAALPDPYPRYEQVRALGDGALFLPEWNSWFLTSHSAVSTALRSPLALSGTGAELQNAPTTSEGMQLLSQMMLWRNGTSHRRLRALVEQAFTPRVVEEQRELVRHLLGELLGEARGEVDIVAQLAHPLPARVIMTMLGLKGEDEEKFVRWSGSVAELIGGASGSPELMAQINTDAREMRLFFRDLAEELRAHPQPGLLSALAAAQDGGERLSGEELLSNAVLLLAAGHETTSNLIPGALLELSRQPGAWRELTEHPEQPGVADELLRLVSPVQFDARTLSGDLTVDTPTGGEQTWRAGQHLHLLIGAANRDPEVFADPDLIDWHRPNSSRHLAFAAGPHYCLGASLARLEIAEVFAALAGRFPGLRVTQQHPPYKLNPVLRGPTELHVQLS